jgi:hypothetical protein
VFDIRVTTEVPDELDIMYGTIQIGDFNEMFTASLSDWAPEHYERQWQEAAQRLVDGELKSAFVTSFLLPSNSFYFVWWPCYRSGETVYVHNQLRLYEQIQSPFCVEALYDYVPDRETVNEDGMKISEWQMPLEWVRAFAKQEPHRLTFLSRRSFSG